jgi:hypothetical protein
VTGRTDRRVRRAGDQERLRPQCSARVQRRERIEPVGILHDFRFDRSRSDARRKTVRLDGVPDVRQAGGRVAGRLEKAEGALRGKLRGAPAIGRIFRDVDAVVQPGGRQHDFDARAFLGREFQRRRDHALEVRKSVAGIRAWLRTGEFTQALFPVSSQSQGKVLGPRTHGRVLLRRAGARRRADLALRFASATPMASRAQAASSSGSSSTSAGTCQ